MRFESKQPGAKSIVIDVEGGEEEGDGGVETEGKRGAAGMSGKKKLAKEDSKNEANRAEATFAQLLQNLKLEKGKVFPHDVLGRYFWKPEWTGEVEAQWEVDRVRPRKPDEGAALKMNTRRKFLIDKLETVDDKTKAAVAEKVAELQQAAQADADATLNIDTKTPEECAK